ncbi:MAG: AAA family ATPase [Planctomycetes bacterium]|nr:AAA family ATPase [Planctomycetota bacterium]
MYLEHFRLREMPFNLTPGTKFLHFTNDHRQALEHLLFGIRQRKGFIVLTGEVGAGKTTLCRALLRELDTHWKTALILNPRLTEPQLLRLILIELGHIEPKGDKLALREKLNNYLLTQAESGNEVVLIIDESQCLSRDMLENIRLLSNLETETRKLIQIVLIGQPELREMLNDHRLRQLRQRISVAYHLEKMSLNDTADYIRHRLKVAGANGKPSFDTESIQLIYKFSEGIPRQVNSACDMAMLAAYSRSTPDVSIEATRVAIDELEGICR